MIADPAKDVSETLFISSGERDRLADMVINKQMKPREIADAFNISSNNIRLFTTKRKNRGRNYDKKGTPVKPRR